MSKMIMDLLEGMLSIVVIRIDDTERILDGIFAIKDGLSSTKRFLSFCRFVFPALDDISDRPCLADSVSNPFLEFFFDSLTENKDNIIESCFFRIIAGKV